MELSNECANCKSSSIELEQGNWICSECGLLVKDKSQFQATTDQEGSTYTNNNFFAGQSGVPVSVKRSISCNRYSTVSKNALERAKRIGEYLKLSPTSMKLLLDTHQRMLKSSVFKNRFFKSKIILGGVIAFIVAQQAGLIIPMEKICERVGCLLSEFKIVLNMVLQVDPKLKPSPRSTEDLIPFIINEAKFEINEKRKIEENTSILIKLIDGSHIMEGKNRTFVIYASLYLVWKSLKPEERAKIKFKNFCSTCHINYSLTGLQRYKELVDHLTQLAVYLPWIKESPKQLKLNIHHYIKDILDHSNIILQNFLESSQAKDTNSILIQETSNLMEVYKPVLQMNYDDEPEISDSEIDSYIRNDKETLFIQELKDEVESKSSKVTS